MEIYLKSDEGIAIQSTYSRLKQSFVEEQSIQLGIVNYIDYTTEFIDARNLLNPFVHKRKSFLHEQEVRALVTRWPMDDSGKNMDFSLSKIDHGLEIKVDVSELIARVFVLPTSPYWFLELVGAVV